MQTLLSERDTRVFLSRAIVDAMLDADALGFLLSSKHFCIFLQHRSVLPDAEAEALRLSLLDDRPAIEAFHLETLTVFRCIYIAEAKLSTHEALMAVLDNKLSMLNLPRLDDAYTQANSGHIELAWRYRRACALPLAAN